MASVQESIEVDVPTRTAYNQWTQFEEFPRFMEGVEEVQQIDDTHLRWRADLWGKHKEWTAEITEQGAEEGWQPRNRVPDAPLVQTPRLAARTGVVTCTTATVPPASTQE